MTASGSSIKLNFVTGSNVGSRNYLMKDDSTYETFYMLNQEFAFDVDVSNLGCGLNGALYMVNMAADGDLSDTNKAGAAYGTGYCDSQCPRDLKFIAGKVNFDYSIPFVTKFDSSNRQTLRDGLQKATVPTAELVTTEHAVRRWTSGRRILSLVPIPLTRAQPT